MIRIYRSLEEMNHPWVNDDSELFMTKDEIKNSKRVRTPKESAWKIDAVSQALRDN